MVWGHSRTGAYSMGSFTDWCLQYGVIHGLMPTVWGHSRTGAYKRSHSQDSPEGER
jgi:hypothetical protein